MGHTYAKFMFRIWIHLCASEQSKALVGIGSGSGSGSGVR